MIVRSSFLQYSVTWSLFGWETSNLERCRHLPFFPCGTEPSYKLADKFYDNPPPPFPTYSRWRRSEGGTFNFLLFFILVSIFSIFHWHEFKILQILLSVVLDITHSSVWCSRFTAPQLMSALISSKTLEDMIKTQQERTIFLNNISGYLTQII